jgi:hypothetical protein
MSESAFSQIVCKAPDRNFKEFSRKFENDLEFQSGRIILPLVMRAGEYGTPSVTIKLLDSAAIKSFRQPLILSQKQQRSEHVQDYIVLNSKYFAMLEQGEAEGDAYRVNYRFINYGGCWFLEDMHDRSL